MSFRNDADKGCGILILVGFAIALVIVALLVLIVAILLQ